MVSNAVQIRRGKVVNQGVHSDTPGPNPKRDIPRLCRGGSSSLTFTGVCLPQVACAAAVKISVARLLLLFLLLPSPVAIRPL
jgi:hypothetical protein